MILSIRRCTRIINSKYTNRFSKLDKIATEYNNKIKQIDKIYKNNRVCNQLVITPRGNHGYDNLKVKTQLGKIPSFPMNNFEWMWEDLKSKTLLSYINTDCKFLNDNALYYHSDMIRVNCVNKYINLFNFNGKIEGDIIYAGMWTCITHYVGNHYRNNIIDELEKMNNKIRNKIDKIVHQEKVNQRIKEENKLYDLDI